MPALEISVTIGAITFNSVFSPGATMYLLKNTEEILGALGTRRSDTPNQGGHGSQDSLSQYEPRVLHFQGEMHATSQSQRVTMQQNLDEELSLPRSQSFDDEDGYKLLLITDEDGVAKQLYAKIVQMPQYQLIETGMPESRSFEFTMFAPEPEVYAQALTTGTGPESFSSTTFTFQDGALPEFQDGALPTFQDTTESVLEVTNDGNFATPVLITITGPTTDPIITNLTTDKKLEFSRNGGLSLLATETLVIDTAAATAVKTDISDVETNVRTNLSLDSVFFDLVPGVNEITLFDDTPGDLTGQMDMDFRDAWL